VISASYFGVNLFWSSATLENVAIRAGGVPAVNAVLGAPVLRGCVIEANSPQSTSGSTVALWGTDALLEDCVIRGNDAYPGLHGGAAGVAALAGAPTIRGCVITGNTGHTLGAIYAHFSTPTIEDCTIAGNAGAGPGAVHADVHSSVTIRRSIVWGNCGTSLYAGAGGTIFVSCSDVEITGDPGPGDVSLAPDVLTTDPLFCQPLECSAAPTVSGAYSLLLDSPASLQPCGLMGGLRTGCTTAIEPLSWSGIKARYR
jgi:hypothetical protein